MQLDCEITAARRRASRLAGLMWLRNGWIGKTAVGRQALRLAVKASVDVKPRWPFVLQKYPVHVETFQLAWAEYMKRQLRRKNEAFFPRCVIIQASPKHPKHRHLSLPSANCGGAERR